MQRTKRFVVLAGSVLLAGVFAAPVPVLGQAPQEAKPAAAPPVDFPAWAYPWLPDYKLPPDDGVPRRVPDSSATYTVTEERDLFFAPDWHPADHPPMPDIVARGRKPDTRACASCHRVGGTGGPENSSLAGLPPAYFVQQMADFKSGARKFAGPARSPVTLMNAVARAATDEEVAAAAAYFAALKPVRNLKVIETDSVPKTFIVRVFHALAPGGGTEPIGERIVEVPADLDQFEHRDSRTQFMVYVPPGSVARGETLVKTGGGGRTQQCAICHGVDLKGVGNIPGIAGRSPSYLVRQLYDFKTGARAGSGSPLMKPTVEKLTHQDMIAITAYIATLAP
jgi:cytochrome c553